MIPTISQKMLTQQLQEMERDGFIQRKIYPEIPPRIEYSITALGLSICLIYKAIHQ
ncbi:MAG: helix-turn-helix transcriptional regulator [Candidatus Thiodiazotropha sp. (ex Monitilora ramsayi)]|nr:helix-turn-helix transcriptional regulator [Candidatus Thiodiazotropha sp. (ex Monitilora ramsayi)]